MSRNSTKKNFNRFDNPSYLLSQKRKSINGVGKRVVRDEVRPESPEDWSDAEMTGLTGQSWNREDAAVSATSPSSEPQGRFRGTPITEDEVVDVTRVARRPAARIGSRHASPTRAHCKELRRSRRNVGADPDGAEPDHTVIEEDPIVPPARTRGQNYNVISIGRGIRDGDIHWLIFVQNAGTGIVRTSEFAGDGKQGIKSLNRYGILVYGARATRELIEDVSEFNKYELSIVATKLGWNASHFLLNRGPVSPSGTTAPPIGIPLTPALTASGGTAVGWRRAMGDLLTGQTIPEFFLSATMAGPLLVLLGLEGNLTFDATGASSSGKTTLLRACATVAGPASGRAGGSLPTFNSTVIGLEELLPTVSDQTCIIVELGATGATSTSQQARFVMTFAMRNSQRSQRRRHGSRTDVPPNVRAVLLTSSNQNLARLLCSFEPAVFDAVQVRWIQVPVPNRLSGIFDTIPAGFENSRAAIGALGQIIDQQYGTAMPRFIRKLVDERTRDEAGLRVFLQEQIRAFMAMLNLADADGVEGRIAEAFAIVAAAGTLAQRYRVLPRRFNPNAAALACYRLNQASGPPRTTIVERLQTWLRDNPFIDLRRYQFPHLTDQELNIRGTLVWRGVGSRTEILIAEEPFRRIFPDYRSVLQSPEAANIMIRDRGSNQTKRTVRAGGRPERVYCFVVPSDIL